MTYHLDSQDALLIVDVQYDFLAGGSLAVPDAEAIIPVLNSYIKIFKQASLPVFATRDYHPVDHCSFQVMGGQWPVHCVAGSRGAEFCAELKLPSRTIIVSKAITKDQDSYSAFQGTDLEEQLKRGGTRRLFVGGLATDFCVLHSVKSALSLGFQVMVLKDAVRAVNLQPDDGDRARKEMRELGAVETLLKEVVA